MPYRNSLRCKRKWATNSTYPSKKANWNKYNKRKERKSTLAGE